MSLNSAPASQLERVACYRSKWNEHLLPGLMSSHRKDIAGPLPLLLLGRRVPGGLALTCFSPPPMASIPPPAAGVGALLRQS